MTRTLVLPTIPGALFSAHALHATLSVRPGPAGQITLTMSGDAGDLDALHVDAAEDAVTVTATAPTASGGSVIVHGDVIGSTGPTAPGTVSIGVLAAGDVWVGGRHVHAHRRALCVDVLVPIGTPIDVSGLGIVDVAGVHGEVELNLAGDATASVRDAEGEAAVTLSESARAEISGTLDTLRLDLSDTSRAAFTGTVHTLRGTASGTSRADVVGLSGPDRLRVSGVARAHVTRGDR